MYCKIFLQNANNDFSKEKGTDNSAAKRESMLSDLASAHDAYMELTGNLQEGSRVIHIFVSTFIIYFYSYMYVNVVTEYKF